MVGTVPPDYDFVVTDRDPIINFFDSKTLDGDAVKVELNGRTLNNRIDLKGQSSPVPVSTDLTTGKNTLKITALNIGTVANNTVGVAFPAGTVIYDKDINGNYKSSSSGRFFYDLPKAGASFELDFGLPLIRVDDRYPEAAQHIIDTERKPQIRTIDRANASARRTTNTNRYSNLNGDRGPANFDFQIDEAPAALFLENKTVGSTTRPIPSKDNEGAGGSLGQQTFNYGPQNKTLPDGSNVDFFAIGVPNPRRVNGTESDDLNLTGRFGENNLIYGLAGNDTISAAPTSENSGNNTLFGGPGLDTLYGGSGEDQLLGQSDKDILYGGDSRDSLYGGIGNDDLTGSGGADDYWFAPGEGTDYVYDYDYFGGDRIRFNSGLKEPFNFGVDQISTRAYRSSLTTLLDFGTELLYGNQVMARFPLITDSAIIEAGVTIVT